MRGINMAGWRLLQWKLLLDAPFKLNNVNNTVVLFGSDVGVYFSESGLRDIASPMIWNYIPNMDVKEIGKTLFRLLWCMKILIPLCTLFRGEKCSLCNLEKDNIQKPSRNNSLFLNAFEF